MKCPFELPVKKFSDYRENKTSCCRIREPGGMLIADNLSREEADYIVHVLNNHDKLVEAINIGIRNDKHGAISLSWLIEHLEQALKEAGEL